MRIVSIIGLGLIGGSLGLALKRTGAWEVVGYARRPETAKLALKMGAVDRIEATPRAAAKADLIFVCTPVMAIREIFGLIADQLQPGCVVSDVASTKVQVINWAKQLLPAEVSFIGGHPMAGKETPGIEAAEADLFKNCSYCLVQTPSSDEKAMTIMEQMVLSIGALPVHLEAEMHDFLVAGISHLPLIISTALVESTTQSTSWPQMAKLASSGYRDTSRLASTHPVMSRDICLSNQKPIIEWLDRFDAELKRLRELIENGNEGLENIFQQANLSREQWLNKRK